MGVREAETGLLQQRGASRTRRCSTALCTSQSPSAFAAFRSRQQSRVGEGYFCFSFAAPLKYKSYFKHLCFTCFPGTLCGLNGKAVVASWKLMCIYNVSIAGVMGGLNRGRTDVHCNKGLQRGHTKPFYTPAGQMDSDFSSES